MSERRVPVGRQLGLLKVEPSAPSRKIQAFCVSPEGGIVYESFLREKEKEKFFII